MNLLCNRFSSLCLQNVKPRSSSLAGLANGTLIRSPTLHLPCPLYRDMHTHTFQPSPRPTRAPVSWLSLVNRGLLPLPSISQTRSVVRFSKKGKKKTVKAVAKRFYRTGSGKLKYWPAGKNHNMLKKSNKRRRQLRKPRYASKTQLKTLNKMISGW